MRSFDRFVYGSHLQARYRILPLNHDLWNSVFARFRRLIHIWYHIWFRVSPSLTRDMSQKRLQPTDFSGRNYRAEKCNDASSTLCHLPARERERNCALDMAFGLDTIRSLNSFYFISVEITFEFLIPRKYRRPSFTQSQCSWARSAKNFRSSFTFICTKKFPTFARLPIF